MKKILYIFLLTIFSSVTLQGQITIDSIFVHWTPGTDSLLGTVDSIYFSGTSDGSVLKNIQVSTGLIDACGTLPIKLTFEGCDSVPSTFYDTTIIHGYFAGRIWVFTEWDTTLNCTYPTVPLITDTLIWDSCAAILSTTNRFINENQIKIYPNPAQDLLQIEYLQEDMQPRKIQLMNLNGAVVKSFELDKRLLDIQDVISGIYVLMIETEDGHYVRKKVIIQ